MKRIALDTMVINRVADQPSLLSQIKEAASRGCLVIIGNPMVRYELEQTKDTNRRDALVAVWDALPRQDILATASFYGVGLRYGQSCYGDGSHTGLPLQEARTKGRGRARDAVIATTAAGQADVLVTDDGPLTEKVKQSRTACEVWSSNFFCQFVNESCAKPRIGS